MKINFIKLILILSSMFFTGFSPVKGVKKLQLKNGLTLIIKENHSLPLVSVQVWVMAGSVNEVSSENGISHFLEHMLFKGTTSYSTGEISSLIESHGGVTNAATGKELTNYYIDIPSENFSLALQILSEVSLSSIFPAEEIEKERLVILEEIKRRNDNPDALLWDRFESGLFTKTPYRYPVIGSTTTVNNINQKMLIDYYHRCYAPNNLVVVVVGDVKYAQAVDLAKKYFGVFPSGERPLPPDLIEPKHPVFSETIKLSVKQSRLMMGVIGPAIDSPDQIPLDALAVYLAGGRSFSLYRILREEKKLVWGVDAYFATQQGSGFFLISAEGEPEKIKEAEAEIKKIINDLKRVGIDRGQLARAKESIKNGWLFGYETNHGQASQMGYFASVKQWPMLKNYLSRIEKVTEKDLQRVLKIYFEDQDFSTLIANPE